MKSLSSLLLVLATLPASATIINLSGLRNTGVDAGGTPLGTGAPDPHYSWFSNPGGVGPTPVVLDHTAFPVGPWLDIAAGPNSRWISPNTNGNGPGGSYVYRTTFTVPAGVDPTQVYVRARWAGDDPGASIALNGVTQVTGGPGFNAWGNFELQRGFVTGLNIIDITVPDAGGCCAGLRIDYTDVRSGAVNEVAIPGLWSSGTGATDGTPGSEDSLAPGVSLVAPGVVTGSTFITTSAGGFPVGSWLGDNNSSAWIAPSTDTNGPEGDYYYQVSFDMTGLDPSSAHIFGRWSVDNFGNEILLNGVPTGNTNPAGAFNSWVDFSISTAEGDGFLPGVNTLTFVVNNAPASNNPAGVRWEVLSATAGRIPEPSGLGLIGLLGLALRRRRSK
jgi:hypothetical protein